MRDAKYKQYAAKAASCANIVGVRYEDLAADPAFLFETLAVSGGLPCGLNGAVYFVEMEKDGGEGSSPSRDLSPDSQFRATGVVSHWLQATGVRAAAMPFAHLGESEERRRPPGEAPPTRARCC